MVGFHHARNAENVGLGRNDSAARLGGDDGTLCEDSGLLCRDVQLRHCGCVDQLIEARVKIGISEQSILVTPDVVEHHAALGGGEDQSSLFVDEVSYVRLLSHSSAPMAGVLQNACTP